ncbi:MAG: hypothetical protein DLM70_01445 [Chloroflexi bacterium]|nr:MAG: hypothetical protein DLM70_01445 [Chloroflexota bacterium]
MWYVAGGADGILKVIVAVPGLLVTAEPSSVPLAEFQCTDTFSRAAKPYTVTVLLEPFFPDEYLRNAAGVIWKVAAACR